MQVAERAAVRGAAEALEWPQQTGSRIPLPILLRVPRFGPPPTASARSAPPATTPPPTTITRFEEMLVQPTAPAELPVEPATRTLPLPPARSVRRAPAETPRSTSLWKQVLGTLLVALIALTPTAIIYWDTLSAWLADHAGIWAAPENVPSLPSPPVPAAAAPTSPLAATAAPSSSGNPDRPASLAPYIVPLDNGESP